MNLTNVPHCYECVYNKNIIKNKTQNEIKIILKV
jgi:hypothetical protein